MTGADWLRFVGVAAAVILFAGISWCVFILALIEIARLLS